jgi:hypothetical protein
MIELSKLDSKESENALSSQTIIDQDNHHKTTLCDKMNRCKAFYFEFLVKVIVVISYYAIGIYVFYTFEGICRKNIDG